MFFWGKSSFTPTQIQGNQLWLDASDTSSITDSGGQVSQWNDKSGNANHSVQGTGSAQPTTGSNTINGMNVLSFDALATWMPTPINWLIEHTAFIVFEMTVAAASSGKTRRLLSSYDGTGSLLNGQTILDIPYASASPYDLRYVATGGSDLSGANPISINTPYLVSAYATKIATSEYSANTKKSYVDSTEVTSGNYTASTETQLLYIGTDHTYHNANFLFGGYMAEIIFYNRALTIAERGLIDTYLANKWGITLP